MTSQSRLTHPNGEATNEYLHSVVLGCGLGESLATRVATELAGQFDLLAKGEPITFEDLQVGDIIHTVRDWDGMTERRTGVVSRINGNTAYYLSRKGHHRLLTTSKHDGPSELYLLHRPTPPKPAPKQLADMQPGLVIDNRGDSWVFDGRYAYRAARNGMTSRVPMDEETGLAPWKQEATLDYNVEAKPATTPDLAEASGKRTEYGVRYVVGWGGMGGVESYETAADAVKEATRRNKLRGNPRYVEPVSRTTWGDEVSAWNVIEPEGEDAPASGPVKYGVRDHEGQRAWVSRDRDGNLRIGVEEESAYLTKENATDLIQHLTELAGEA